MSNYVKDNYGVPADVGREVIVNGCHGIIESVQDHYIHVLFDDCPVPARCHPTWRVTYGKMAAQAREPNA